MDIQDGARQSIVQLFTRPLKTPGKEFHFHKQFARGSLPMLNKQFQQTVFNLKLIFFEFIFKQQCFIQHSAHNKSDLMQTNYEHGFVNFLHKYARCPAPFQNTVLTRSSGTTQCYHGTGTVGSPARTGHGTAHNKLQIRKSLI